MRRSPISNLETSVATGTKKLFAPQSHHKTMTQKGNQKCKKRRTSFAITEAKNGKELCKNNTRICLE